MGDPGTPPGRICADQHEKDRDDLAFPPLGAHPSGRHARWEERSGSPRASAENTGVVGVSTHGWTVNQTRHRLICDTLRASLLAGPGSAKRPGPTQYWASAVLYLLLLDHPIDRRGRCRSCRRSGEVIGLRRRPCRIHLQASYWLLHQPGEALLLSQLASELGASIAPAGTGAQSRSTDKMTSAPSPGASLVITGTKP
jgi:hypothetical protein